MCHTLFLVAMTELNDVAKISTELSCESGCSDNFISTFKTSMATNNVVGVDVNSISADTTAELSLDTREKTATKPHGGGS